jgi:uncharacterized membrane protein YqjE
MALQHRGIILFQNDTRVSLVDECCGRITARSFLPLLVSGMYTYDLEYFAQQQYVKQQELFFLPLQIIHEDFLFLHHLFEIALLFAPVGSCVQGLFGLLLWVYDKPSCWFSEKNKKFVLFKILSLLGIWPVREYFHETLLEIAEFPIDRINEEVLQLVSEEELEQWLARSILCHPLLQKMKTKLFLESVPCYD